MYDKPAVKWGVGLIGEGEFVEFVKGGNDPYPELVVTGLTGDEVLYVKVALAQRVARVSRMKALIKARRKRGDRIGRPLASVDIQHLLQCYRIRGSLRAAAKMAGVNVTTARRKLEQAGVLVQERASGEGRKQRKWVVVGDGEMVNRPKKEKRKRKRTLSGEE